MKPKDLLLLPIAFLLLPGFGFAQWTSLGENIIPDPYRTWSVKMAEDNSMWLVSTYDAIPPPNWATPKVHLSVSNGESWTTSDIDFGEGLIGNDIAPIDGQTAFLALSTLGGLHKTTDGAQSWTPVVTYPYWPLAVHFFNGNEGWVFGRDSNSAMVLSVTADGGDTWTHLGGVNWDQPPGTSLPSQDAPHTPVGSYFARSFYDYTAESIIFGSGDGSVWLSNDKGYNWERITTPLGGLNRTASNVSIKNSSTFMVVSDTETGTYNALPTKSFATYDGGQTWIEGSPGVTAGATHYIPGTFGAFVVAGHNDFGSGPYGSAVTTDLGETWEYLGADRILAIDFNSAGAGIGACCNNNWFTAKGQVFLWDQLIPTREIATPYEQPFDVFPNPASEELQVQFAPSLLSGAVEVQILQVDGSVLQTYHGIQDQALTIQLAGFSPGIYLVRLSDDKGAWVQRFVKR